MDFAKAVAMAGPQNINAPVLPILQKGYLRVAGDAFGDKARYPNIPIHFQGKLTHYDS